MSNEGARILLSFALFLVLVPALTMIVVQPGTAEFVISGFTLVIGAAFTTLAIIVIHLTTQKSPR